MSETNLEVKYPRRRFIRGLLRAGIDLATVVITNMEIKGREHLPRGGPLIVVANHFAFADPAVMIKAVPYPIEFIGGFVNPGAPPWATFFSRSWGYYPVMRGTASRLALKASERVLNQGGVLGIFPEAGNWAQVLRPARPGTAFLAARTGARILPMGFEGVQDIFKQPRARVTIRIGKPFGPVKANGRGREHRRQLDQIGHEIMQRIAELIPPERRGFYSDDPAIREAAKGTEIYPWDNAVETDFATGQDA